MIYGLLYKSTLETKHYIQLQSNLAAFTINAKTFCLDQECFLAQDIENGSEKVLTIGTPPQVAIIAWARLDNRDELIQKLELNHHKHITCIRLILEAYLRFGEQCTSYLFGDFSFAIYDIRHKRMFCARDQMGARPFYFYNDEHIFAFSSSMHFFHSLKPLITLEPCMEWASKFLISNLSKDFRKTAYRNIFKLPPAYQLSINANTITEQNYFKFNTNKIMFSSSNQYIEYYRSFLESAIKTRVQVNHPLGSEISGGIDSSTVTAYAALYYPGSISDLHTFGFAFLEKESHYILQVNQLLGIPMGHICCNESLFNHDPSRILNALGAPVEHNNAISHEIFYALAAGYNIKTLLSGFGGDEFVTSIYGYLYHNELLKDKKYFKLYQNFKGNALIRALRMARFLLYKTDNNAGLKNFTMANAFASRWEYSIVTDELIKFYGLKDIYDKVGQFDHGYNNLDQFTLENRLAPFVSTRMENCSLLAKSYGIDYRWPLLDVRLIQAFLSIPSSEKYHKGKGRYLHRRAIANVVPQAIVAQNSKYMGNLIRGGSRRFVKLNDDLHQDLAPILNIPKLRHQEKILMEHTNTECASDYASTIHRNIQRVNHLDNWLKYYFNDGCNWANTPDNIKRNNVFLDN